MAGAWTAYTAAKRHLGDGAIDLDSDSFRMSLFTSASNAATLSLSTIGSVTNEVSEANGYSSSGKPLTGVSWAPGLSAASMRFTVDATQWIASGGNINNVKFAVIWRSGSSAAARKLLFKAQLSTAQFNVPSGNTLTIAPSTAGIFELA